VPLQEATPKNLIARNAHKPIAQRSALQVAIKGVAKKAN
jgi:hypothetical protein